jgi:type IV secretory pathway VirB4 component
VDAKEKTVPAQGTADESKDAAFQNTRKIIAPSGAQVTPNYLKIGDKLVKTFFIFSYPRYLSTGWFEPIINLPNLFDISIFVNPVDTGTALKNLRKKSAQIESQINDQQEKGMVRDPLLETALKDIESLRDTLQQAQEKMFSVGVYIAVYADSTEQLARLESQLTSLTEAQLIYIKPALFEQLEGFFSVLPVGNDHLSVTTPLNSGPLSSFFPFVSEDLTSDEGIMYGVNRHNNSLVIFDRFSLENANQVVFAKSGSGKSYSTKLEIIRSLMVGIDVIVIDPENEYQRLAEAFGGSFFNISLSSEHHINPFDIPIIPENELPADVLRSHIVNLAGLIKLMLGGKITPEEDAVLDRAITETYASREITPDSDFSQAQPPLLEDLETVLRNLDGGLPMAERLYKFTKGSFAGFVNQSSSVDINNRLIVFSIRDLEEELRPVAMYVVLNFIWNLIRAKLKRRILIVDEAWIMMKNDDSATFLFGLVKRGRKYYLGISTITQDVEDFLRSPYGRPIITNSTIQLLLKQAPATIEVVAKAFDLTEAEKNLLLGAEIGTGLFFAGKRHVAIQIIPSFFEDKLITTDPKQLLMERKSE